MHYNKVTISREAIWMELIKFLRQNSAKLVFPETNNFPHGFHWVDSMVKLGLSTDEISKGIYEQLVSSGKADIVQIPVGDSGSMNIYNAYYPARCKLMITEEVLTLVRIGVLAHLRFENVHRANFDLITKLSLDKVMLTEYGVQFIRGSDIPPYYADQYLKLLDSTELLDNDLRNYLAEGLGCLHHQLGRAAAILLRSASEHTLRLLINSIKSAIKDEPQRKSFEDKINKARTNIEDRAEVVFKRLESDRDLVPSSKFSSHTISNRLRASFHSIRELGGKAVHSTSPITLSEVRDHYTLYASSVYPTVAQIIAYHRSKAAMP